MTNIEVVIAKLEIFKKNILEPRNLVTGEYEDLISLVKIMQWEEEKKKKLQKSENNSCT